MYLLDILVKISQALLTPAITIMSIYLVHKNNSYKQNHDLYKKRLPIYQSVWNFVDKIITDPDEPPINEALRQFRNETKETVFFFGQDIIEYIKEIEHHAKELKINLSHKNNQDKYDENKRAIFSNKFEEEINWFFDQPYQIQNKFMKYLSLNK